MSEQDKTLEQNLDELAANIVKKAEEKDVTLDEKVKALKALTQLLAVKNKARLPAEADDDDGADFGTFAGAMSEAAPNGRKAPIPGG